jgi:GAF domain-containing protein
VSSHGSTPPQQEPLSEVGADLREAIARAPLAVGITKGPEHVVELLNPAACALLGAPDDAALTALGEPIGSIGESPGCQRLLALLDSVYADGSMGGDPEMHVEFDRDGRSEERVFNFACEPLPGADGVRRLLICGQDVTDQALASRRLAYLAEAGPALLEASLEQRDALDQAAQVAVRALGDLCVINLVQQDGSLVRAAVVHRDPEMDAITDQLKNLIPLKDSPNQRVLDSGKPMMLRHLADRDPWSIARRGQPQLWDRLGLASSLVVPIVARGRTLGTFSISSRDPDRYTDEDLALAEGLALRAGLALDTAELYDSERRARETAVHAVANTAGLLKVTAALSGALSPAAIAEVVISEGAELLGAGAAALFVRVGDRLELVQASGWPSEVQDLYRHMSLQAGTPSAEAALKTVPVWIEKPDDMELRYPRSAPVQRRGGYQAMASLPLIVEGTVVGAMAFYFPNPHRFGTDDRTFLLALAGQCAQSLDRARLYVAEQHARAAAERQRDRVAVLAEASLALDASQSQDERLQRLTKLAVPRIADWCSVHLLRDGRVEQIAYAHENPDKIAFVEELAQRYPPKEGQESDWVAEVIRTREARMISEVPDELLAEAAEDETHLELIRALGIVSAMVVPLVVRGRALGAITLIAAESGQHFAAEDLAFAQDLANRAALALDNARLYEDQRHIAATLQTALLPHELPSIPGVQLAGRYMAAGEANEVGGDLYDVFASPGELDSGESGPWSLLISDVCGKGATAAALTALIRYTVRAEASYHLPPCEVLRRLNRAIIHQLSTNEARFCTATYGRLTPTADGVAVAMASGGHLPARILRAEGTIEVTTGGGTILGVYAEPALAREDVHLNTGDTLLLITDGVTEARGFDSFYGEERLDALLTRCAGQSASSIASMIIEDVLEFQAGAPRDDVAVLVVQASDVNEA